MSFIPKTWVDDQIVYAEDMNRIEQGIANAVSVTSQTLTDAQKQQARSNIRAQNGTFVSELLNTKGWYRVVTGGGRSGGILTVQHSYNNAGPSSLKLLVTLSYDASSLKCIEYTNYIASAITNVRIVSNALQQYYIDVYYNVNGSNSVAIDFISTGLGEAKCQVPVYIGADDTLPSGENLMATMEYLNPPMQLGVEYRTTERYQGKPVYAKRIFCESMPSGAGYIDILPSDTEVPNALISTAITIRCYGKSSTGATIPFYTHSGDFMQVGVVENRKIRIYTAKAYGGTAEITVHYVKSTD